MPGCPLRASLRHAFFLFHICSNTWIEAQHIPSIADQINPVTFHGHRRSNSTLGPIKINILIALWDHELPEEPARLLVETHQDAAVALLFGVSRVSVIRANVHTAGGNYRSGMGFG